MERKRKRLAEAELRESTEMAFEAYGEPLENVTVFKDLERVMTAGDDDWPAVVFNLRKERKSWGRLFADIEPGGVGSKGVRTVF